MNRTMKRIRILGSILAAAGLAVASIGFLYGMPTANDGLESAQAMYAAQGVTLNYNDAGQLVDRGTPEGAQAILAMLEGEWKYPINHANLDPSDPLVNTRDELMYQYAVITWHVLHGKVGVQLTDEQVPITYRGVTYNEAGTYDIEVGAYYAELDRTHPIEGQLRGAWSPQALALLSALAGGHANEAAGEVAWFMSLAMGGMGLLFAVAGGGLVWVSFAIPARPPHDARQPRPVDAPAPGAGRPPVAHVQSIPTRHAHPPVGRRVG